MYYIMYYNVFSNQTKGTKMLPDKKHVQLTALKNARDVLVREHNRRVEQPIDSVQDRNDIDDLLRDIRRFDEQINRLEAE